MAVAFNSFDTLLAPFIKVDGIGYEEVKQGMQNFIFSVNSNSRAGAEPAFSNITFDLTPPEDLINQKVIVGGERLDFTYGDCQKEIDMLNMAFFEVMLGGDANGKLFAYPIPTYNIHKRFDWENPNNKLLWEMAGKYGLPYFANFINSDMDPSSIRSMCPVAGDTKVVYYSNQRRRHVLGTMKSLYENMKKTASKTAKVIANGEEVECKINRFETPANHEITLVNGAKIKTTANHLNLVLVKDENGERVETHTSEWMANEQDVDLYLPYSIKPFEKNKSLSYDDGRIVGIFLGDGSFSDENSVAFSLNKTTKLETLEFVESYCASKFGAKVKERASASVISGEKSCTIVYATSPYLMGLIKTFVNGNNALTKEISPEAYQHSIDFRNGIIDGLMETDGNKASKRIYTSSEKLRDSLVTLCATLGKVTNTVFKDDREGRLGENTNYCIRIYAPTNTHYKNQYIIDDNYMWVRVKSIDIVKPTSKYSYCAEIIDETKEPIFMLANGIHTHNCRLRLDLRELRKKNGGLFGAGDATGSIGVVTINLPRIAYENKGNRESFFKELRHYLDIAKDSLEIKRKWLQENILDTNAIPAYMEYVGTMNNHFSVIGEVGVNEMCENFMGKNILDEEAHAFAHEVQDFILNALQDYQEETGNLYAFEATPAESTCYRLALKDKMTYKDIITQGNGGDPYYTNSCHIPVKLIEDIDTTFKHQEDLQTQFNSGTVIHIYLEGAITGEQAKSIIYNVFHKYRVPYVSLSPISRYCDEHGYIKENVDICPACGARLKKYQRITGYLRCIDNFNNGKAAEFRDRKQIKL